MKAIIEWTLGIVFIIVTVWTLWWAAKTLSYKIWYEDMVREEIVGMVRPECLLLLDESMTLSDDVTIEMVPESKIKRR